MPPKKLPAFSRVWSLADEVRILEGLAAHAQENGAPPARSQLCDLLAARGLDKADFTLTEIYEKVRSLRNRYLKLRSADAAPLPPAAGGDAFNFRKYLLSVAIWGNHSGPAPKVAKKQGKTRAANAAADTRVPRTLQELQRLYPSLSMSIDRIITTENENMVKKAFQLIEDDEARRLDARVKEQRLLEAKVTAQRISVRKKVLTTLIKFMD